jgi:hypothetical protein
MTPGPTQTPVRAAGARATQRFEQFYQVTGRAVLLFAAIDLLLHAGSANVMGTNRELSAGADSFDGRRMNSILKKSPPAS